MSHSGPHLPVRPLLLGMRIQQFAKVKQSEIAICHFSASSSVWDEYKAALCFEFVGSLKCHYARIGRIALSVKKPHWTGRGDSIGLQGT